MPPNRQKLVKKIFDSLSRRSASRSCVTVQDLVSNYNAANHPAVVGGRATADDVLEGIVFDILGEDMVAVLETYRNALEHEVEYDKFTHHYAAVSSATNCDVYFERLLYSTWSGLSDVWEESLNVTKMLQRQYSTAATSRVRTGQQMQGVNYVNTIATPYDQLMAADVSKNYQKRSIGAGKK